MLEVKSRALAVYFSSLCSKGWLLMSCPAASSSQGCNYRHTAGPVHFKSWKMWVFFIILVCKPRTKQIQIQSNICNPTVIISKYILLLYLDTFEIGLHFTIVGSTVVSTLLLFHSCIILCRSPWDWGFVEYFYHISCFSGNHWIGLWLSFWDSL